ncbi:hypothetical protein Cgig2_023789 [Carnegiea gigantea]|uniref:Ubiquitin-like protease family profile domain-containing protein n=1 Tax=Carnegiea gigantea TaxID=171969 RepID=A0A9Q1Q5A0_9CARY|nr:hypothetical protein Cgig2_023789 [Carnegiea gigantea]
MQQKLEGPVSNVQMNGFSLLIQFKVWFYEHTTRFVQHDKCRFPRLASWDSVNHGGRYDVFQLVEGIKESKVIPVLRPWKEEMLVPMVRAFMKIDGFRDYILDGEGVLSYKERLERARKELRAEKGKHVDTLGMLKFGKSHANELEARLKMCAAPGEDQDTGYQPRGDVGEDVQSDSGLESLARAVIDLGKATAHEFSAVKGGEEDATCQTTADILGASCDAQSTSLRMADATAPVDDCDDPSAEVEDVGGRAVDATVMPYGEVVVGAQEPVREQQQPEPIVEESDALPRPHVGEEAVNTDAPGPGIDEMYVGGDLATEEGVCTTPASSTMNVQDCTPAATKGAEHEWTVDPSMESMHHGPPMTADSMVVDHEACVQAPLGEPVQRVTTPEEDAQTTGDTERTSPDADDVGCEDDGGRKSSNIVAHMRRKPWCWKPAAIHGSPFTDPTSLLGARKSKKEGNEGMTGANEPRAANDPGEGSVHPSVFDVQPLSVEGSGIGPSTEELNKLKLTKQVLVGYIFAPLSALEMELVTNVRSRFKGVRPNGRQWEEDLQECLSKLVPTSWLWGLIHVVPKMGVGDRFGKYCNGNLAMDLFTELLHRQQQTYPNLYWMSVFLKHHTSVFMPLLETSDGHCLPLVVDLCEHSFLVYDSLPSLAAKNRREFVDSTVSRLCVL